jgi:hypothetical protein
VRQYREVFDDVHQRALDPQATREFLAAVGTELKDS